jgi:DNA-directed RNA polymerase specialized sigma24 family protein
VIGLDRALTELEQLDPRQAQLVEARFFGGLEVRELTQLLGISEATVMRDWRLARAWLAFRIKGSGRHASHP